MTGREHDVSGLTAAELERAQRDLRVSLALAMPGSPTREPILAQMSAIDGIADLFGTSPERVAEMVAADWYGVRTDIEVSDRVLNLSHVLDALSDEDAHLIEHIARRLADEGEEVSPAA